MTLGFVSLASLEVTRAAAPWDDGPAVLEVLERIDYAGSHGPDLVVLMGEETVVPGPNAADAGKRICRRFTDVFRKENGEWRHDLRNANVIAVE